MAQADQKALLDGVHAAVVQTVKAGKTQPVVVFDLDATLYDNRPRTLAILKEWAAQPQVMGTPASTAILGLKLEQVEYLVSDTVAKVKVTDPRVVEQIFKYWWDRFFGDRAVLDWPTAGGPAYVNRLYGAGAHIVYLTGRDAPQMLMGTTRSLQDAGYPIGLPRTQLIMKPAFKTDDEVFKATVMADLKRTGHVVALFDNESGNVNVMKTHFPDATVVFLTTMFNPKKAKPLKAGILKIKDFVH
jgi:hypothetical protein